LILNEIMPYIWIGVIVFAAIAEIYTIARVTGWFIPSALASFVLSLTGFKVWLQVLVFFISASVMLVLSRTVFRKLIQTKTAAADPDSLTGKSAIVIQEINNYKNTGTVRADGLEWPAKSDEDDIIYETGLVVIIVGTEGACVICSR